MWNVIQKEIRDGSAQKFSFSNLAIVEVLEKWRSEQKFRRYFSNLLSECSFQAFTWEVKPFNGRVLEQNFEFVLAKSTRLEKVKASPRPFAKQFKQMPSSQSVIAFQNIENDATFVTPRPLDMDQNVYSHLGAFLRYGPKSQRDDFWKFLAESITDNLSLRPLWLSTAKVGRHWFHARIDSKPKHYRHQPYLEFLE